MLPLEIENLILSFTMYECRQCKKFFNKVSYNFYKDYPICYECLYKGWVIKGINEYYYFFFET